MTNEEKVVHLLTNGCSIPTIEPYFYCMASIFRCTDCIIRKECDIEEEKKVDNFHATAFFSLLGDYPTTLKFIQTNHPELLI